MPGAPSLSRDNQKRLQLLPDECPLGAVILIENHYCRVLIRILRPRFSGRNEGQRSVDLAVGKQLKELDFLSARYHCA